MGFGSKEQLEKSDKRFIGKRFGRLVVIERVNETGRATYRCQCDCGNEKITRGVNLTGGKVLSCGCLKAEMASKQLEDIRDSSKKAVLGTSVEGTNLKSLSEKMSKNNTSGYKGVYRMKNGRYRAAIYFKGKNIHLGVYDTKEDAAEARKVGEETYFKPMLEKYKDKLE